MSVVSVIVSFVCLAWMLYVIVRATIDPITDEERAWIAREAAEYIERTSERGNTDVQG